MLFPALRFSREILMLLFRTLCFLLLNLKQLIMLVFSFKPEADVLPQRILTALKTGSSLLKGCRPIHSYESYHTNPSRWAVQFFSKSKALTENFPISQSYQLQAKKLLIMSSQTTCYYPDKSRAPGYEACNATLAGPNGAGSACCAAGDICTTGGFCLNDMYYPYRGACTDRSWNSNSCASECLNGE